MPIITCTRSVIEVLHTATQSTQPKRSSQAALHTGGWLGWPIEFWGQPPMRRTSPRSNDDPAVVAELAESG